MRLLKLFCEVRRKFYVDKRTCLKSSMPLSAARCQLQMVRCQRNNNIPPISSKIPEFHLWNGVSFNINRKWSISNMSVYCERSFKFDFFMKIWNLLELAHLTVTLEHQAMRARLFLLFLLYVRRELECEHRTLIFCWILTIIAYVNMAAYVHHTIVLLEDWIFLPFMCAYWYLIVKWLVITFAMHDFCILPSSFISMSFSGQMNFTIFFTNVQLLRKSTNPHIRSILRLLEERILFCYVCLSMTFDYIDISWLYFIFLVYVNVFICAVYMHNVRVYVIICASYVKNVRSTPPMYKSTQPFCLKTELFLPLMRAYGLLITLTIHDFCILPSLFSSMSFSGQVNFIIFLTNACLLHLYSTRSRMATPNFHWRMTSDD